MAVGEDDRIKQDHRRRQQPGRVALQMPGPQEHHEARQERQQHFRDPTPKQQLLGIVLAAVNEVSPKVNLFVERKVVEPRTMRK